MGTLIAFPVVPRPTPETTRVNLATELDCADAACTQVLQAAALAVLLEDEIDFAVRKLVALHGYAAAERALDLIRKRHGLLTNV